MESNYFGPFSSCPEKIYWCFLLKLEDSAEIVVNKHRDSHVSPGFGELRLAGAAVKVGRNYFPFESCRVIDFFFKSKRPIVEMSFFEWAATANIYVQYINTAPQMENASRKDWGRLFIVSRRDQPDSGSQP